MNERLQYLFRVYTGNTATVTGKRAAGIYCEHAHGDTFIQLIGEEMENNEPDTLLPEMASRSILHVC